MVPSVFRRAIRLFFQSFGVELSRYRPQADKWLTQKALLADCDHAPVILDLGANVGQTVESYKTLFPDGHIYSFEPFPNSYHALFRVASRYTGVYPYQLAIADEIGVKDFYINEVYHSTNSLLPRPQSGYQYYPEGAGLEKKIQVKTDTLDAFVQHSGLTRIDILKMDIQGGELAALRGGAKLLAKQAVSIIFTEVMFVPHYEGGDLFHGIHDFLIHQGYTLFGIYDHFYADSGQLRFADAIFISNDMRRKLEQETIKQRK